MTLAKISYNEALNNLEKISEEIHHQRELRKTQALTSVSARPQLEHSNNALHRHSFHQGDHNHNSHHHPVLEKNLQLHDYLESQLQISDSDRRMSPLSRGICKSATEESLLPMALRSKPYDLKATGSSCCSSREQTNSEQEAAGPGCGNSATTMDDDIEQWTEIRLSHSNSSSSSSYSNQSTMATAQGQDLTVAEDVQSQHSTLSGSSSSDEPRSKVTCTTIFQEEPMSKKQTLSQWLTRSNNLRLSGRRQSLDLLIDAGDKVKDVFSMGFQKVAGRTLERRNSESEMNTESGSNTTATSSNSILGTIAGSSSSSSGNTSTSNATDFFLFSRWPLK